MVIIDPKINIVSDEDIKKSLTYFVNKPIFAQEI
jgi:hypothetical protein